VSVSLDGYLRNVGIDFSPFLQRETLSQWCGDNHSVYPPLDDQITSLAFISRVTSRTSKTKSTGHHLWRRTQLTSATMNIVTSHEASKKFDGCRHDFYCYIYPWGAALSRGDMVCWSIWNTDECAARLLFSSLQHFSFRRRLLGGNSIDIDRHFHYQIMSAPCSVTMITRWVAVRSQEALQGAINIWQWKWRPIPKLCHHLATSFGN
jgi:hypothetical protein